MPLSKPNLIDFAVPMIKVTPVTSSANATPTTSILSMMAVSPNDLKTTTLSIHPLVVSPFESRTQFNIVDTYSD